MTTELKIILAVAVLNLLAGTSGWCFSKIHSLSQARKTLIRKRELLHAAIATRDNDKILHTAIEHYYE